MDARRLALLHACHVGLRNPRVEDHAGQVRDGHDHRAGVVHGAHEHDLADLGVELGDDAVDGRVDDRLREGVLGTVDVGVGRSQ